MTDASPRDSARNPSTKLPAKPKRRGGAKKGTKYRTRKEYPYTYPIWTQKDPKYNTKVALAFCDLIASGMSMTKACETLRVDRGVICRWANRYPDFYAAYTQARAQRVDWMGEELTDIADDGRNDFVTDAKGKEKLDREAVLRSKLRAETRQWLMARLDPKQWGDRQQLDIHNDWALLTLEERERKAYELIEMLKSLQQPVYVPKPIEYRWAEPDPAPDEPGGIGRREAQ